MTAALALAAGLVVYGTVINLVDLSGRTYVALNVGAGAVVAAVTLDGMGVSPSQVGLDVPTVWAVAASVLVLAAAAVGVLVLVRWAHRSRRVAAMLDDGRLRGLSTADVVGQATLRIPVGTAAFEELAFRGALLAAFSTVLSTPAAVVASSVAFGLWHLAPTWRYLQANQVRHRVGPLLLGVGLTTLGGAALCVLRLVSGGLLLPWAVHTALNSGGLVAAHLHQRE